MQQEREHPLVGMPGCDRALFARVWARVGGGKQSSPVEVLPPEAAHTPPPCPTDDSQGGFLQTCIQKELENERAYLCLSTRAPAPFARTLVAMAADERRHARQLAGAYFLLFGVRFSPSLPAVPAEREDFWAGVRRWFLSEQETSRRYAAAAETAADSTLATLYRDLAREEAAHAELLRSMAEHLPLR